MWHKNEYVMCRHKDGCALKRQQAHSPGQSEAAPREQHDCTHSPCKGKSINYQVFTVYVLYVFYAFALALKQTDVIRNFVPPKFRKVQQTEKNGLFSLVFENEAYSEFEKFIEKFKK